MQGLIKQFNRLNLSILLLVIACINYLGFKLYGGEEQYFAFARQFMNPDWIPDSFTLTQPAGGNLLFEIVAGFALRFVSFEQLAFFGRLLNFALLSIPLALIFRHFKLSNIEAAVLFQLFFLPHQSLFAGEWIFQNFEVKTLAYIFVFFGIYYLIQQKLWPSAGFAAIATWFHFLAGGWFFLILMIYFIVRRARLRNLGIALIIYGILVLPLFLYLAGIYLIDNPTVIEGVNTNWIYAYERLPNHLGIFKSGSYFFNNHFDGILISFGFFLLCLLYFRRFSSQPVRMLNTLNIIIFTQQFFFIGVALIDRNGNLLKTYPFRTSSLSALFILLEMSLILKIYFIPQLLHIISDRSRFIREKMPATRHFLLICRLNTLLLAVFLIFLVNEGIETIRGKNTDVSPPSAPMLAIMDFIRMNTPGESIFIFLGINSPLSFNRTVLRENFVVWKFTPTTSRSIYEWYDRENWRKNVSNDNSKLNALTQKYHIDYVISSSELRSSMLKLVKTVDNLRLYLVLPD